MHVWNVTTVRLKLFGLLFNYVTFNFFNVSHHIFTNIFSRNATVPFRTPGLVLQFVLMNALYCDRTAMCYNHVISRRVAFVFFLATPLNPVRPLQELSLILLPHRWLHLLRVGAAMQSACWGMWVGTTFPLWKAWGWSRGVQWCSLHEVPWGIIPPSS